MLIGSAVIRQKISEKFFAGDTKQQETNSSFSEKDTQGSVETMQ